MKYLPINSARQLAIHDKNVMKIFNEGYRSTMAITNPKLMNDIKVRPNYYLVNDDFEVEPKCFTAIFDDQVYMVLRCIYVSQAYRGGGLATKMINELKTGLGVASANFLQVGVESTENEFFSRLDGFYSRLGFKRTCTPIKHPGNKEYFDYFWSDKPFEVKQDGYKIAAFNPT